MKNYFKRIIFFFVLFFGGSLISLSQQRIDINFADKGRMFEGIGALSAGASSRLLIDYEEPYRSQILDFLFKPQYGASLHHLKVEIGGDVNSTDGTEPSHARTRQELEYPKENYYQRGYEWWLMKEAKKRNPDIYLDCLPWGAPGWIDDGNYYSQNNIDYIIAFIKGAKKYHDLDIDYTGIWNERMYNIEYIKNLRKSLDENGLNNVKIVVGDQCCGYQWQIADDIMNDRELLKSVDIIGDHYPERSTNYNSSEAAKSFDIPIWNSEGGPWKGDWSGFKYLAKMYNRDYIKGRMTRNITWSLITSYYSNLSLPNSGLMTANTPWSGYYDVEPAVWAAAHITQFTKPGWNYIDSGCGYLNNKGSYVTIASPSGNDFSIIVETMDSKSSQTVNFDLRNISAFRKIFVWSSKQDNIFEQQKPISIHDNNFTIILEPQALYTFSTTTGQQKPKATPAKNISFPFPFKADFENEKLMYTPKYFSDLGGAFEVAKRGDGKGKCLRQVITRMGIRWGGGKNELYQTVIGDTTWTDYSVSSEFFFPESYSHATIFSRATKMYRSTKMPDAYILKLESSGKWELMAGSKKLDEGIVSLNRNIWHSVKLDAKKDKITAIINEVEVSNISDNTYTHGMAGLGSSVHNVDFDNFEVKK